MGIFGKITVENGTLAAIEIYFSFAFWVELEDLGLEELFGIVMVGLGPEGHEVREVRVKAAYHCPQNVARSASALIFFFFGGVRSENKCEI